MVQRETQKSLECVMLAGATDVGKRSHYKPMLDEEGSVCQSKKETPVVDVEGSVEVDLAADGKTVWAKDDIAVQEVDRMEVNTGYVAPNQVGEMEYSEVGEGPGEAGIAVGMVV